MGSKTLGTFFGAKFQQNEVIWCKILSILGENSPFSAKNWQKFGNAREAHKKQYFAVLQVLDTHKWTPRPLFAKWTWLNEQDTILMWF